MYTQVIASTWALENHTAGENAEWPNKDENSSRRVQLYGHMKIMKKKKYFQKLFK